MIASQRDLSRQATGSNRLRNGGFGSKLPPMRTLTAALALLAACGSETTQEPEIPTPTPGSDTPAKPESAEPIPAHLTAAVASADRPAEDRERDADRKPAEVMAFFGIEPGMTVAELMAGRGYYSELLTRAVGASGVVYVHNTPFVLKRFAEKPIAERLARPGLENARRWDRELESLELPAGKLDAVLLILFYHDTFWQKVDRAAMLAGVRAALEPGGVFGVIDHHAAVGAGTSAVKTLHRIEADVVKREVLAAGFELAAESELLRHPEDDRTANVFDDAIRGKTDRFIYKFVKPR